MGRYLTVNCGKIFANLALNLRRTLIAKLDRAISILYYLKKKTLQFLKK